MKVWDSIDCKENELTEKLNNLQSDKFITIKEVIPISFERCSNGDFVSAYKIIYTQEDLMTRGFC